MTESQPNNPPNRKNRLPKKYNNTQSVFDEPDILPGRVGEVVDRDWSCDQCGANLRGLPLETPCRECGFRNWYRPPPPGTESYESWLTQCQQKTHQTTGLVTVVSCAVIGGMFAIITAMVGTSPPGFIATDAPLLAIFFGPLIEESLKVAAMAYVIEVKPYLFKRRSQIFASAAGAAVIFTALENVAYIFFLMRNPSEELILYRWTVCFALHIGCTLIAATGLANVWQRATTEYRQPRIADLFPSLVTAIIIHGVYNAGIIGLQRTYPWLFK